MSDSLQAYLTQQYVYTDDEPARYYAVTITHDGRKWLGMFAGTVSECLRLLRADPEVNRGIFKSIEIVDEAGKAVIHTYHPNENGAFDLRDFRDAIIKD